MSDKQCILYLVCHSEISTHPFSDPHTTLSVAGAALPVSHLPTHVPLFGCGSAPGIVPAMPSVALISRTCRATRCHCDATGQLAFSARHHHHSTVSRTCSIARHLVPISVRPAFDTRSAATTLPAVPSHPQMVPAVAGDILMAASGAFAPLKDPLTSRYHVPC